MKWNEVERSGAKCCKVQGKVAKGDKVWRSGMKWNEVGRSGANCCKVQGKVA